MLLAKRGTNENGQFVAPEEAYGGFMQARDRLLSSGPTDSREGE
jgi:hypothetical protein